jgi:hypothetical protein
LSRNKLYIIIGLSCAGGYIWLLSNLHTSADHHAELFGGCWMKYFTGIPCPSCGVTRAITLLLEGDVIGSIMMNPLGLIVASIMLIAPVWLLRDVIRNKQALFETYQKTEHLFKRPQIYVPSIALVIANWIWNIAKDL